VLAPNAKLRPEIVPSAPVNATNTAAGHRNTAPPSGPARISLSPAAQTGVRYRHGTLSWSSGGTLKIIAAIEHPPVIAKILTPLGLPARAPPRSPDPAQYPKLSNSQRAGEELFSEFFRKAGLDVKKLGALQEQHNTELRRILDKQKADAIKRASRAKDTVHSSISSQSQALELLAANKPFFQFPFITLDKPFLIWATPHSNIISDSTIAPFNSWAKISVDSTQSSGFDKLSFYFLWDNPSDFYAVINAATFMSASGHLEATAYGGLSGIDPTSRYSDLGVSANFALWAWWVQPPTPTPYATQIFTSISASASFWDNSESASVSDGFNLDKTLFLVPPKGVVVFEVTFAVGYSNGHGHVVADFESGDFKVGCPVVVVSLLTSPSALAAS